MSERSKVFSDYFNTDSFASYEEMLEATNPDLLLILTPSGLHYEHTKVAFEYGCNVLVEKPITMLPSQAIELEKISKSSPLTPCLITFFKAHIPT